MSWARSERLACAAVALAAGLAVGLAGCSLSLTEQTSCASDDECQTRFGGDYACGEDGFCFSDSTLCTSDLECRQRAGSWAQSCVDQRCAALDVPDNCTLTYPADLLTGAGHEERVVFGNLMDRSLATHEARENSARLAAVLANGAEGLAAGPYGLVFCNIEPADRGNADQRREVAVSSARWLVEQAHVPAIVGPASSGDTQAVFSEVADDGALVISPSATSPALTTLDNVSPTDDAPGLLWRTAAPDSFQGTTLSEDITARSVTNVGVVFQAGAYGDGLSDVVGTRLAAAGVSVQLFSYSDAADRGAAILAARDSTNTDIIFVSSSTTDGVAFLNSVASDAGTAWDGRVLLMTDSAGNQDLLDGVLPANQAVFAQVRGTRPQPASGLIYDRFVVDYTSEYGSDVTALTFTANAYDAAMMLIAATGFASAQADGITGLNLARGLRRLSDTAGSPLELYGSNIPAIHRQLGMGNRVNINGASGPLDYDLSIEETEAPVEVWTVIDCGAGPEFAVIDVGAPAPACP